MSHSFRLWFFISSTLFWSLILVLWYSVLLNFGFSYFVFHFFLLAFVGHAAYDLPVNIFLVSRVWKKNFSWKSSLLVSNSFACTKIGSFFPKFYHPFPITFLCKITFKIAVDCIFLFHFSSFWVIGALDIVCILKLQQPTLAGCRGLSTLAHEGAAADHCAQICHLTPMFDCIYLVILNE